MWLVAMTEPRRESVAKHFLEIQGRTVYYPLFRETFTDKIQPLFPRYIFIHSPDGIWRFLRNTIGIIKVLMRNQEVPEIMKDSVMMELRKREQDGLIQLHAFQTGDEVSIVGNNVFAGWKGIYEGMNGHGRCRVMLSMLGQHVPVVMDPMYLKAAA